MKKYLFHLFAFVCVILALALCNKVDTSVSLSGTDWSTTDDGTKVELSFADIEFVLTIVALKEQEGILPGEGFRLKGSYEYESPEAKLYCRTIEFIYNNKTEAVESARDMRYRAVVVDNILSLYNGDNDFIGTLDLRK